MKLNEDRELMDTFCRAYLLESVDETSYGDYKGLVQYIVHEASYEQVLLAVFDQRKFVSERNSEYDTDIDRTRRISNIENMVQPALSLGVAVVAGTSTVGGPIKRAIENLLRGKSGRIANIARNAQLGKGAMGIAKGGLTHMVLYPMIALLVSKMIFVTWEKSKSVCRVKCKKQVTRDEDYRSIRIKICESQCKIAGFTSIIAKLRNEITNCNKTENPERCQSTLVKNVAKYNDMLVNEKSKLHSAIVQLNKKVAANKHKANAARPPEIR